MRARFRLLALSLATALPLLAQNPTPPAQPPAAPAPPAQPAAASVPRQPPKMSMEQAAQIARTALAKRGTDLRGRFLSEATYHQDASGFPHEAAREANAPFWHLVLRDPQYFSQAYPVAPIRVLVFSERNVAILTPE